MGDADMKWALLADGSEHRPILRGSRDLSPIKYECVKCHRWFIEPEYDVMVRDKGDGLSTGGWWCAVLCQDCATAAVHAKWKALNADARAKWDELTDSPQNER